MRLQIHKWGNSLALRIPKSFAAEAGLSDNGAVDLKLVNGRLVIEAAPKETVTLAKLLRGVTAANLHGEWQTGPAAGKDPDAANNRPPTKSTMAADRRFMACFSCVCSWAGLRALYETACRQVLFRLMQTVVTTCDVAIEPERIQAEGEHLDADLAVQSQHHTGRLRCTLKVDAIAARSPTKPKSIPTL